MTNIRFDWRWIALIVIIALIVSGPTLPWPVLTLILAASGGYLLYRGWQVWGGGNFSSKRVSYWRGQRIEMHTSRKASLPSLRNIRPALIYLVIGGALTLSAIGVVLNRLGY